MLQSARQSLLRAVTAWILILVAAVQSPAQQEQQAKPSTECGSLQPQIVVNSQKLEDLVRKYTSTVELGETDHTAGKIRMVWLTHDLLDAIVDEYGRNQGVSKEEIAKWRSQIRFKLERNRYIPFLLLIEPSPNGKIGRPAWGPSSDGHKSYPEILLRGAANHSAGPYKYDQILGHGEPENFFFTRDNHAYVIFWGQRNDGKALLQPSETSFVIDYRGTAFIEDREYSVQAEFNYNTVPVPIHDIVAGVRSWNAGLATLTPKPRPNMVVSGAGYPSAPDQTLSYASQRLYTEASSTAISHSDMIGIIGLLIGFAQLVVQGASLL